MAHAYENKYLVDSRKIAHHARCLLSQAKCNNIGTNCSDRTVLMYKYRITVIPF